MGDLQLTHDGVGFTRFRLPPKNQERVWNYLANWTILLRRVDFEMRSRDGWVLLTDESCYAEWILNYVSEKFD